MPETTDRGANPSCTHVDAILDHKTIAEFYPLFYHTALADNEDTELQQSLMDVAGDMRRFIHVRAADEISIHCCNAPSRDHSMIQICTKAVPFLLDSVTEAMIRKGYTVYKAIHPVVKVARDKKGTITDIVAGDSKRDYPSEAIIYLEITHITSSTILNAIERMLRSVLEQVYLSVNDWPRMVERVQESKAWLQKHIPENHRSICTEIHAFLDWLADRSFTFLAYAEYGPERKGCPIRSSSLLGIFNHRGNNLKKILEDNHPTDVPQNADVDLLSFYCTVEKVAMRSPVHRHVNLDMVTLRCFDANGHIIGLHRFIGLFTTALYYQSVQTIPMVREKIEHIVHDSGLAHIDHSRKMLLNIFEMFMREDLLRMSSQTLQHMAASIMELMATPRLKVFVQGSPSGRFISCMIFVPSQSFSAQQSSKIQEVVLRYFQGEIDQTTMQMVDVKLARYQVLMRMPSANHEPIDVQSLEDALRSLTREWHDEFEQLVAKQMSEKESARIMRRYRQAFPITYTERFDPAHAVLVDLPIMESVIQHTQTSFNLYGAPDSEHVYLKVYHANSPISLSDIMPMMDNMGFRVEDSQSFQIAYEKGRRDVWMHYFTVRIHGMTPSALLANKEKIEEGLAAIWGGKVLNDRLNSLIMKENLHWRSVMVLRAYNAYLRQIVFPFSPLYVVDVLLQHHAIAKAILSYFMVRFDPALSPQERSSQEVAIVDTIEAALHKVHNSSEDTIVRRFLELVKATLRTNYFQLHDTGHPLSFKFRSDMIPDMPKPVMYAEIFVFSQRVEGIHLRGGPVARGGIRWSDRAEDYRTEILGLVKAQMTKNSVIVPVGSKGGFLVKKLSMADGRDAFLEEGKACYELFLQGLLDITDNRTHKGIERPALCVCYDDEDPYLVVAADKGTATFSDIANAVSHRYGFWLDDAFASGGSNGYDHKKMGITARGAWVAAERHFYELGLNIHSDRFTAIGIGDMSGDVFGNGMLYTKTIQLLGAFNHRHIFIDPTPDPLTSYKERVRLFALPRSGWNDYNPALISKGGGVFERSAKRLTLTPEMQALLQTSATELTPDALIAALLKAQVDLLYNGGIGTYVKASTETNDSVGDKHNDYVRVNGDELRCRVVAEGGNLGFTQKARIEYATHGGCINTDAIDNSGGVDCSDHEVNIKIALQQALHQNSLTSKNRNRFLAQMTDEIAELVLRDNRQQNLAISLEQYEGPALLMLHERLMRVLEESRGLNRSLEGLPSTREVMKRAEEGEGLTRPELSVLLAYSKMLVYENVIHSKVPDDPYYENDLLRYFPASMQKKYAALIRAHPLRREIIATVLTNSLVNRVGTTFCILAMEDTDLLACDIARAYSITRDVFDLRATWDAIEGLIHTIDSKVQCELFMDIRRMIAKVTFWFLRNMPQPLNVEKLVRDYSKGVMELRKKKDSALVANAKEHYAFRLAKYKQMGLNDALADDVAGVLALSAACDIVKVARACHWPVEKVGAIYYRIETRFDFHWLRAEINRLPSHQLWDRMSINTLKDEIYDLQMHLCETIITQAKRSHDPLESWEDKHRKSVERYDRFIADLHAQSHIETSMMIVATKRAQGLLIQAEETGTARD